MITLIVLGMLWRHTWIRAGLLALSVGLFAGCSQNFEGDDTAARSLNEAGKALYESKCASCHGANGTGGSGGPLVACSSCGSTSSLIAKIEKDMPSASNPLRGSDASDVADYVYHAFNESAVGSVERSSPVLPP